MTRKKTTHNSAKDNSFGLTSHIVKMLPQTRNRKSDTELSNEFWKVKDNKRTTNITWEILGRHQAYNISSKRCLPCLNENLKIALHVNNNMLNRRTEILNKCRHKDKYALISYDSKNLSRVSF